MKQICARCAREALEPHDFTVRIDAQDLVRTLLPRLSEKQRRVLIKWAEGKSAREIGAEEGVTAEAIQGRITSGLRRLRELSKVADE